MAIIKPTASHHEPPAQEEEGGYVSRYLTHFVGRGLTDRDAFEILCTIIASRCLLPGGSRDQWKGNVAIQPGNPLSSNASFLPQAVCFCDIPLSRDMLEIHTAKYSKFGLSFDRVWLSQQRGASPVFYLARGSCLTDHRFSPGHPQRDTQRSTFFDLATLDWLRTFPSGFHSKGQPSYNNMFLWYVLSYCKFFDETLDPEHQENYYMEREWRTIGRVQFCLDNIAAVVLPESFKTEFEARKESSELAKKTLPI